MTLRYQPANQMYYGSFVSARIFCAFYEMVRWEGFEPPVSSKRIQIYSLVQSTVTTANAHVTLCSGLPNE